MAKPLHFIHLSAGTHNDINNAGQADPFTGNLVVVPVAGEIVDIWAVPRNAAVDIQTTFNVFVNDSDSGVTATLPAQAAFVGTRLTLDGPILVNFGDAVKLGTNGEATNVNIDTEFTLTLKVRERWDRSTFFIVGGEALNIQILNNPTEVTRVIPVRSQLYGVIMHAHINIGTGGPAHTFDIMKNGADSGIRLLYRTGQLINTSVLSEMTGQLFFEPGDSLALRSNGQQAAAGSVVDFLYLLRRA